MNFTRHTYPTEGVSKVQLGVHCAPNLHFVSFVNAVYLPYTFVA